MQNHWSLRVGQEESYHDSLADADTHHEQERGTTCSAARTTSTTRVQIEQGEGIPPRQ